MWAFSNIPIDDETFWKFTVDIRERERKRDKNTYCVGQWQWLKVFFLIPEKNILNSLNFLSSHKFPLRSFKCYKKHVAFSHFSERKVSFCSASQKSCEREIFLFMKILCGNHVHSFRLSVVVKSRLDYNRNCESCEN